MPQLKKDDKIYVAGHRGLVGSAISRKLDESGYKNLLTRSRVELDLEDQAATRAFLEHEKPAAVVLAAALVGGIAANSASPADFIARNLSIQNNVIWGAHRAGVDRLLFLGSSCVYPREAPQPIPESAIMTGPPEPTNAPYAVAKIAGLTLCDALRRQYGRTYFTVMPPNIFGPQDNFDPENSHVMAAMIRRFHEALPDLPVTCWGSGSPKREFLFSEDAAEACVHFLSLDDPPPLVNIGTGTPMTIRSLAETVQRVVGHTGPIEWDVSRPDGFPEKTNDVALAKSHGWSARTGFEEGIERTYAWFKEHIPVATN